MDQSKQDEARALLSMAQNALDIFCCDPRAAEKCPCEIRGETKECIHLKAFRVMKAIEAFEHA